MPDHHLAGLHHYRWDNRLAPALTVAPGEIVVVSCEEGLGGKVTRHSTVETFKSLDLNQVHCMTGPIFVRGAEPGDVLEVQVLDINAQPWAWTSISPGIGVLADEFGETWHLKIWELSDDRRAELCPGVRVPIEPFCGVMGVALASPGEHLTLPPRATGSNLDTRHLCKGSTLYLPVEVQGALFSCGDGHLAQGDGEVCGTAMETSLDITLRFDVRKGKSIRAPQFETHAPTTRAVDGMGYFSTTCPSPDIDEGVKAAVHDMVELLGSERGLSRVEAYILCSVAGDLKISVPKLMANHQSFVTFNMPKSVFGDE